MSTASTFGTFLETIKILESSQPTRGRNWSEADLLTIVKSLSQANGSAPLKAVMSDVSLPKEVFLGAVVAGRDQSLFEIDDGPDEPVLKLTKLGRSFVG